MQADLTANLFLEGQISATTDEIPVFGFNKSQPFGEDRSGSVRVATSIIHCRLPLILSCGPASLNMRSFIP